MYRIAVLGDYDSIYGFATLGLDTFPVTEPVEATKKLTRSTGLDVIASGGVSSMEDLARLCQEKICGAIIGKALYEGKVDLAAAIARFERKERIAWI